MTDDEMAKLGLLVSEYDASVQPPLPRYATAVMPPGLSADEALRQAPDSAAPPPPAPPPPPPRLMSGVTAATPYGGLSSAATRSPGAPPPPRRNFSTRAPRSRRDAPRMATSCSAHLHHAMEAWEHHAGGGGRPSAVGGAAEVGGGAVERGFSAATVRRHGSAWRAADGCAWQRDGRMRRAGVTSTAVARGISGEYGARRQPGRPARELGSGEEALARPSFMPSYNCWTKHGERGVMMEDNEEEEDDDMYPKYGDTGTGQAEDEEAGEAKDEEASYELGDDLRRSIPDAHREPESANEKRKLKGMLEDHQKKGQTKKGYNACTHYLDETEGAYLDKSKKVVYLEHRRFLPKRHAVRKKGKHFRGEADHWEMPDLRTGDALVDMVKDIQVLSVALRVVLPENVRVPIMKLCAFLNAISEKVLNPAIFLRDAAAVNPISGGSEDRLRHGRIIIGGLYITMPASGLMRE
ncbi:hypothetical protein QYE76_063561 [Lolium multiflorum]|uniref:Uncharacterized protein n=1 Tax=Lolium multiflorum TaxID=4521 RepID=A0AAD8S4S9_LOLMU|nr:hypothetical protein QYE76_063561 [Lolium multiflorum]